MWAEWRPDFWQRNLLAKEWPEIWAAVSQDGRLGGGGFLFEIGG